MASVFTDFFTWLFDGNMKSPIKNEDILKYNSPITNMYLINIFMLNPKLNDYLDTYFNNVGLYYLEKEEFFRFIKKCVIDFKINKNSIPFFGGRKKKNKLFDSLRKVYPTLKNYDLSLLCDLIERSPEREEIFSSLGLDEIKKKKTGKKTKNEKEHSNSLTNFLDRNFKLVSVEK